MVVFTNNSFKKNRNQEETDKLQIAYTTASNAQARRLSVKIYQNVGLKRRLSTH